MLGQMLFPPKIAVKLKIPLIFYGENPEEYGNKKNKIDSPKKDIKFFTKEKNDDFFISGLNQKQLLEYGVSDNDLIAYKLEDGYRLVVNCATRGEDLKWISSKAKEYAINMDERI